MTNLVLMGSTRRRLLSVGLLVAAVMGMTPCDATEGVTPYGKTRAIRLIVAQQAGSSNDLISRVMAQYISDSLGQSVVVDNRPGAGGIIGMEIGAHASADGSTLVSAATSMVITPHTYKTLPYDPLNDFAPISLFAVTQNMLVINAKLPVRNVRELIELAKARSESINMASGGSGTQSHLAGVQFLQFAKTKALHVPYKGASASLAAVISGEAQIMFPPVSTAIGQVKEGLLRALAVTGEKRIAGLPGVPTMEESGLAGYVSTGWVGLTAPKGVPKAAVLKLHEILVRATALASARAQLEKLGAEVVSSSPAAFERFIRSEYEKYGALVKAAGLRAR